MIAGYIAIGDRGAVRIPYSTETFTLVAFREIREGKSYYVTREEWATDTGRTLHYRAYLSCMAPSAWVLYRNVIPTDAIFTSTQLTKKRLSGAFE